MLSIHNNEHGQNILKLQQQTTNTQKKSRDESKGAGSGVEILINEPYDDGPGGKGQYTRKIYHVGSHLPGWIKGKHKLVLFGSVWGACEKCGIAKKVVGGQLD